MAYSAGAITMLEGWLGSVLPLDGRILELGSQDINSDVGLELVRGVINKIHGPEFDCEAAIRRYLSDQQPRKIASLFRGSQIAYFAIDVCPGECVIEADLNLLTVPECDRNTFDVVTNFGTTEHVADQVNVFRLVHGYVKTQGYMFHTVPFTGYFNHGLYNYHPIFFFFLAWANNYEIVTLNLSVPHLPYNIPIEHWLPGSERWKEVSFDSGMVTCLLKKTEDKPFALFTDFDRAVLNGREGPEKLKILEGRYDLRLRK